MQVDRETQSIPPVYPSFAVLSQCRIDRAHQLFVLERLGKKVDGSGFDRTNGEGMSPWPVMNTICGSYGRALRFPDPVLEVESVHVRQLNVQNKARRKIELRIRHKFSGRSKARAFMSKLSQQVDK